MRIGSLGSLGTSTTDLVNADCGPNPCTWWDEVWVRDPCLAFLRCADPNNPLVIGMDKGFTAGAAAEAGQITGSVLSSAGQALGEGIGGAAKGLGTGFAVPTWVIVAGVLVGGFVVLQTLRR
jgi:hypothetical protein